MDQSMDIWMGWLMEQLMEQVDLVLDHLRLG